MDIPKFNQLIEPLIKIHRLGSTDSSSGEYANANPKIIVLHPRRPCEDCKESITGRTVSYFLKNDCWIKKCEKCRRKYRVSNPANDWKHK